MKETYPVIFTPDERGYTVYIPDFQTGTQGSSLTNAIEMARDAIGLLGLDLEDAGKPIPAPHALDTIQKGGSEFVSLVDVDFSEYRRKNDVKAVKKNCTLPGWLCYEAEKANLNFSQILQSALKKELHLDT